MPIGAPHPTSPPRPRRLNPAPPMVAIQFVSAHGRCCVREDGGRRPLAMWLNMAPTCSTVGLLSNLPTLAKERRLLEDGRGGGGGGEGKNPFAVATGTTVIRPITDQHTVLWLAIGGHGGEGCSPADKGGGKGSPDQEPDQRACTRATIRMASAFVAHNTVNMHVVGRGAGGSCTSTALNKLSSN